MPNTAPPPDSATRVADHVERYQAGCVRIYPMGTVTGERAGKGLAPLQQMAAAGAVGAQSRAFATAGVLCKQGREATDQSGG